MDFGEIERYELHFVCERTVCIVDAAIELATRRLDVIDTNKESLSLCCDRRSERGVKHSTRGETEERLTTDGAARYAKQHERRLKLTYQSCQIGAISEREREREMLLSFDKRQTKETHRLAGQWARS